MLERIFVFLGIGCWRRRSREVERRGGELEEFADWKKLRPTWRGIDGDAEWSGEWRIGFHGRDEEEQAAIKASGKSFYKTMIFDSRLHRV
ncbi:hypothetical protein V2J09_016027 [Rumex salicifolius]